MGGRSGVGGNLDKRGNINNIGPNKDDVISVKDYIESANGLPITEDFGKWVREVENKGISNEVGIYMEDSSINDRLLKGTSALSDQDKRYIEKLDEFAKSSTLTHDTVLYSGLTDRAAQFWNSRREGSSPMWQSYMSTSPDPIYASGYTLASGANTMLEIHASAGTPIGKTYYDDSTGTEGVLGRLMRFKIGKSYSKTIDGEKVKIIRVYI